jgi:hypothetical protein
MATSRSFQDMLNEYTPNTLLMEEMIKRDWFLSNLEVDNGWKGGKLIVPFKGAGASTVEFGQLAASNDISQSTYVRGYINDYVESWGSIILNHRDLMDHSGKIPETTFLKLIPGEIDMMMDYFKQVVSTQFGSGSHFATFTANGTVGGVIQVDHIDRFSIGQKLTIDDGNSAALDVYVIAININATSVYGSVTVSLTRGGAAADVSAYTTAQAAKCYHPGVLTNGGFQSIRDALLSAANGGSATIHNVSKLAYPILQAVNIDGSAWTASNILDSIFDGYTTVRQRAKGNANTVVMSFKHLGSVMKKLEAQKGPFVVTKQPSASIYGWTEIEVTSVKGTLKLVGIVEMDDDVMFYLDLSTIKFRTNGGFKKRTAPDGREYFEIRNTTGYAYVIDCCLFGELEHSKPGHNAIVYGISY